MSKVTLGFVPEPRLVPIEKVLPSRRVPAGLASSRKYKQIHSSIAEVGLIEPLTVSPIPGSNGTYTLLDGHMRLLAMQELGVAEAPCLEALDDESYTYNNRLNRLSSIQEHYMIRRALERGVSPDRLARALNIDVSHIRKKMNLMEGICPEVGGLVEDRQFSPELFRIVRKMKPTRQVECVELMISANNLTVAYAEALLAATPAEMLVDGKKPRKLSGVTKEQMARMEREMSNLQGQYRLVEQSYGQDVLTLVLVRGYLVKLLANAEVAKFLRSKAPEILEQFETVAETTSLEG
ncbi:plasmid partitioning protein RepB C-terminal domain-containing protein [uncultured Piscinibacter sp.]|uniref:plasmid partitioning protein RepB C-terminal domain-containing protein n=1 Tax=uncultured Piscinibacter sp. TaxID=1131835 RepID=UPI00260C9072|nr:plasmid partitioning protein RepB C-terminal domain-containing protein [uncultured Piscinibacter sp.]